MRDQSRAKSLVVGGNLADCNHGEVIIGIEDVDEANKVMAFVDLNSTQPLIGLIKLPVCWFRPKPGPLH